MHAKMFEKAEARPLRAVPLHAQVAAYIRLGLLQRAFVTAAGSDTPSDVRLVATRAGQCADADVVALCTSYLSRNA